MARPLPQGRQVLGASNQFDRNQLIADAEPMPILLIAIILGIVEGVTEFLPVSSTGHLILATELLGFDAQKWAAFNVIIQLGAILAIVVLYWRTFWAVLEGMLKRNPVSWRFVRNVLIGFLPSAILGFILLKHIEALLQNATVVAIAFIVGGVAILVIEKLAKRSEQGGVADMPVKTAVGIGIAQCLAMIPGVSRSGATIMGALSLGVERRTAAEFSFFLAIPTMVGATTLELAKHHDEIMAGASGVGFGTIAVGFVVSFLVALVVVRAFVHYISKHGFAPFAWYRIAAGAAALVWLTLR
jgi:undecaprenyl-diphosphatase